MDSAALVFMLVFWVIILIPCVGVSWIGVKLINKLGQFPSKTPVIQMSVLFKLVIIEVVSFTILISFFKVLIAEG